MNTLPTPPLRTGPDTFAGLANTYLAALAQYRSDLDLTGLDIKDVATVAAAYVANQALYISTSTSSYTFGNATATFTTQASEAYVVGSKVFVYSGDSFIAGLVTSYSGTTLVMDVAQSKGTGTISNWNILAVLGNAYGTSVTKASAATVDLSKCAGQIVSITGTTTTTGFVMPTGYPVYLIGPKDWQITYNSTSLSLVGRQNYTCSAGDRLTLVKDIAGCVHVCIDRQDGSLVPSNYATKAIFGFGSYTSLTNHVSDLGTVSADVSGVGSGRLAPAAAGYGGDKAIFGYGTTGASVSMTNLVSNLGIVYSDTTGIGTARHYLAAAGYGVDKAIFGYGSTDAAHQSLTNLVSNVGVVSTDTPGVGTVRYALAAASYGGDKAIFGFGNGSNITNLVSNVGVVVGDSSGVGLARSNLAAAGYGLDKAIFGYGIGTSVTNLVSNTGVLVTDATGVGTARYSLAAAGYGLDKAIFGYGYNGSALSMSNLVSNLGIVSTDTTGVGTARYGCAAASYS